MRVEIIFNVDNAAFHDGGGSTAIAHVLEQVNEQVAKGDGWGRLRDPNGNVVGTWRHQTRRARLEAHRSRPHRPQGHPPMTHPQDVEPRGCINHPDRPVRVNLDSEDLCQECADSWARGEGDHAAYTSWEEAAFEAMNRKLP